MGKVGLGSLHVLGLVEVGRADGLLHQDAFTDFLEDAVLNIFVNTFIHAQVIKTENNDVNLIKYSIQIKSKLLLIIMFEKMAKISPFK